MGIRKGNNLTKVKRQNEILIKEVIYKYGPISRIEIAEMLSLTPPTITTNINAMIEQGLIYECTDAEVEGERALGRRPVKLNFVEDAFYVIGVEINPYQTVICLTDLRGKEKAAVKYGPGEMEYQKEMDLLAEKIMVIIADAGIEEEHLLGICVGIPGFIERKGEVRKSTFKSWNNQNIPRDLSRRLDMPVMLENNARVRAIGEELFGKELRPDTFAYYMISYGIACPLYIKNNILNEEQQGACEAGHMVAVLNGPQCEICGNKGCLEEVASERAIVKMVKEAIKNGRSSMIQDSCQGLEDISIKEILIAQECGDELANEVLKEAIMYLGAMLANIINLITPPLVIVDGYIMKLKKNRRQLLEETRKHIFGLHEEEIEIEFVEYSPFNGAKGAAALAIKSYFIKG